MVVKVPLSQGRSALIDGVDSAIIAGHGWCAVKVRNTFYVRARAKKDSGCGKKVQMHRLIINAKRGQIVDHINGDGLDNRQSNLRICTNMQNMQNMKARWGKSKYKGVHWVDKQKKWRAQMTINYKRINLGYFSSEIEAAKAYDTAAIKHFGEFANINLFGRGLAR